MADCATPSSCCGSNDDVTQSLLFEGIAVVSLPPDLLRSPLVAGAENPQLLPRSRTHISYDSLLHSPGSSAPAVSHPVAYEKTGSGVSSHKEGLSRCHLESGVPVPSSVTNRETTRQIALSLSKVTCQNPSALSSSPPDHCRDSPLRAHENLHEISSDTFDEVTLSRGRNDFAPFTSQGRGPGDSILSSCFSLFHPTPPLSVDDEMLLFQFLSSNRFHRRRWRRGFLFSSVDIREIFTWRQEDVPTLSSCPVAHAIPNTRENGFSDSKCQSAPQDAVSGKYSSLFPPSSIPSPADGLLFRESVEGGRRASSDSEASSSSGLPSLWNHRGSKLECSDGSLSMSFSSTAVVTGTIPAAIRETQVKSEVPWKLPVSHPLRQAPQTPCSHNVRTDPFLGWSKRQPRNDRLTRIQRRAVADIQELMRHAADFRNLHFFGLSFIFRLLCSLGLQTFARKIAEKDGFSSELALELLKVTGLSAGRERSQEERSKEAIRVLREIRRPKDEESGEEKQEETKGKSSVANPPHSEKDLCPVFAFPVPSFPPTSSPNYPSSLFPCGSTPLLVSRMMNVQYHSLPLASPSDWLCMEDLLHQCSSADEPALEPVFILLIPKSLKYACRHDDRSRHGVAVKESEAVLVVCPLLRDAVQLAHKQGRAASQPSSCEESLSYTFVQAKTPTCSPSARFPHSSSIPSSPCPSLFRASPFIQGDAQYISLEGWRQSYAVHSARSLLIVCFKARRDFFLHAAYRSSVSPFVSNISTSSTSDAVPLLPSLSTLVTDCSTPRVPTEALSDASSVPVCHQQMFASSQGEKASSLRPDTLLFRKGENSVPSQRTPAASTSSCDSRTPFNEVRVPGGVPGACTSETSWPAVKTSSAPGSFSFPSIKAVSSSVSVSSSRVMEDEVSSSASRGISPNAHSRTGEVEDFIRPPEIGVLRFVVPFAEEHRQEERLRTRAVQNFFPPSQDPSSVRRPVTPTAGLPPVPSPSRLVPGAVGNSVSFTGREESFVDVGEGTGAHASLVSPGGQSSAFLDSPVPREGRGAQLFFERRTEGVSEMERAAQAVWARAPLCEDCSWMWVQVPAGAKKRRDPELEKKSRGTAKGQEQMTAAGEQIQSLRTRWQRHGVEEGNKRRTSRRRYGVLNGVEVEVGRTPYRTKKSGKRVVEDEEREEKSGADMHNRGRVFNTEGRKEKMVTRKRQREQQGTGVTKESALVSAKSVAASGKQRRNLLSTSITTITGRLSQTERCKAEDFVCVTRNKRRGKTPAVSDICGCGDIQNSYVTLPPLLSRDPSISSSGGRHTTRERCSVFSPTQSPSRKRITSDSQQITCSLAGRNCALSLEVKESELSSFEEFLPHPKKHGAQRASREAAGMKEQPVKDAFASGSVGSLPNAGSCPQSTFRMPSNVSAAEGYVLALVAMSRCMLVEKRKKKQTVVKMLTIADRVPREEGEWRRGQLDRPSPANNYVVVLTLGGMRRTEEKRTDVYEEKECTHTKGRRGQSDQRLIGEENSRNEEALQREAQPGISTELRRERETLTARPGRKEGKTERRYHGVRSSSGSPSCRSDRSSTCPHPSHPSPSFLSRGSTISSNCFSSSFTVVVGFGPPFPIAGQIIVPMKFNVSPASSRQQYSSAPVLSSDFSSPFVSSAFVHEAQGRDSPRLRFPVSGLSGFRIMDRGEFPLRLNPVSLCPIYTFTTAHRDTASQAGYPHHVTAAPASSETLRLWNTKTLLPSLSQCVCSPEDLQAASPSTPAKSRSSFLGSLDVSRLHLGKSVPSNSLSHSLLDFFPSPVSLETRESPSSVPALKSRPLFATSLSPALTAPKHHSELNPFIRPALSRFFQVAGYLSESLEAQFSQGIEAFCACVFAPTELVLFPERFREQLLLHSFPASFTGRGVLSRPRVLTFFPIFHNSCSYSLSVLSSQDSHTSQQQPWSSGEARGRATNQQITCPTPRLLLGDSCLGGLRGEPRTCPRAGGTEGLLLAPSPNRTPCGVACWLVASHASAFSESRGTCAILVPFSFSAVPPRPVRSSPQRNTSSQASANASSLARLTLADPENTPADQRFLGPAPCSLVPSRGQQQSCTKHKPSTAIMHSWVLSVARSSDARPFQNLSAASESARLSVLVRVRQARDGRNSLSSLRGPPPSEGVDSLSQPDQLDTTNLESAADPTFYQNGGRPLSGVAGRRSDKAALLDPSVSHSITLMARALPPAGTAGVGTRPDMSDRRMASSSSAADSLPFEEKEDDRERRRPGVLAACENTEAGEGETDGGEAQNSSSELNTGHRPGLTNSCQASSLGEGNGRQASSDRSVFGRRGRQCRQLCDSDIPSVSNRNSDGQSAETPSSCPDNSGAQKVFRCFSPTRRNPPSIRHSEVEQFPGTASLCSCTSHKEPVHTLESLSARTPPMQAKPHVSAEELKTVHWNGRRGQEAGWEAPNTVYCRLRQDEALGRYALNTSFRESQNRLAHSHVNSMWDKEREEGKGLDTVNVIFASGRMARVSRQEAPELLWQHGLGIEEFTVRSDANQVGRSTTERLDEAVSSHDNGDVQPVLQSWSAAGIGTNPGEKERDEAYSVLCGPLVLSQSRRYYSGYVFGGEFVGEEPRHNSDCVAAERMHIIPPPAYPHCVPASSLTGLFEARRNLFMPFNSLPAKEGWDRSFSDATMPACESSGRRARSCPGNRRPEGVLAPSSPTRNSSLGSRFLSNTSLAERLEASGSAERVGFSFSKTGPEGPDTMGLRAWTVASERGPLANSLESRTTRHSSSAHTSVISPPSALSHSFPLSGSTSSLLPLSDAHCGFRTENNLSAVACEQETTAGERVRREGSSPTGRRQSVLSSASVSANQVSVLSPLSASPLSASPNKAAQSVTSESKTLSAMPVSDNRNENSAAGTQDPSVMAQLCRRFLQRHFWSVSPRPFISSSVTPSVSATERGQRLQRTRGLSPPLFRKCAQKTELRSGKGPCGKKRRLTREEHRNLDVTRSCRGEDAALRRRVGTAKHPRWLRGGEEPKHGGRLRTIVRPKAAGRKVEHRGEAFECGRETENAGQRGGDLEHRLFDKVKQHARPRMSCIRNGKTRKKKSAGCLGEKSVDSGPRTPGGIGFPGAHMALRVAHYRSNRSTSHFSSIMSSCDASSSRLLQVSSLSKQRQKRSPSSPSPLLSMCSVKAGDQTGQHTFSSECSKETEKHANYASRSSEPSSLSQHLTSRGRLAEEPHRQSDVQGRQADKEGRKNLASPENGWSVTSEILIVPACRRYVHLPCLGCESLLVFPDEIARERAGLGSAALCQRVQEKVNEVALPRSLAKRNKNGTDRFTTRTGDNVSDVSQLGDCVDDEHTAGKEENLRTAEDDLAEREELATTYSKCSVPANGRKDESIDGEEHEGLSCICSSGSSPTSSVPGVTEDPETVCWLARGGEVKCLYEHEESACLSKGREKADCRFFSDSFDRATKRREGLLSRQVAWECQTEERQRKRSQMRWCRGGLTRLPVHILCEVIRHLTISEFLTFRQVCTAHCNKVLIERYCEHVYVFPEDLDLHRLVRFEPLLSQARKVDLTTVTDPASISPLAIQFLASVCAEATQLLFAVSSYANLAKAVTRAFGRKPEVVVCSSLGEKEKGKTHEEGRDVRARVTQMERSGTDDGNSVGHGNTSLAERNGTLQESASAPGNRDAGTHAIRHQTGCAQETVQRTPCRKSCEGQEGRVAAVQPASGREMTADGEQHHQGQSTGVAVSHTTVTSDSAYWISQSQTEITGSQDNSPSRIAVGERNPKGDTSCCALSIQLCQRPEDLLRGEAPETLRVDTGEAQAGGQGHDGRPETRAGDRRKEQERHSAENGRHSRADPLRTLLGMLPTRSEEDATVRMNEHFDAVKKQMQGLLSAVEEFEQRSRVDRQPGEAKLGTIRPEEDNSEEGQLGAAGEEEERRKRRMGRGREEQGDGDDPLEQASSSGQWGHGRVTREMENWGLSVARVSSARRKALCQGGDRAALAFSSSETPHFRILSDPALKAPASPGTSSASSSPLSPGISSSETDSSSPRSITALVSRPSSSPFLSYRQWETASEPSASEISRRDSRAAQRSTPGRSPPQRTEHPFESSPHSPVSVRGRLERDGGNVADAQLPHLEVFVLGRTGPLTYRMPPSVPFRKLMRYYRDQAQLRDGFVDFLWLHRNVPIRVLPDLSPADYGMATKRVQIYAEHRLALQFTQRVWISLFIEGSADCPYFPRLRFNANMTTPFSRLVESYSRNVGIPQSDLRLVYSKDGMDLQIHLSQCPLNFNIQENDVVKAALRPGAAAPRSLLQQYHHQRAQRNGGTVVLGGEF
ncbi:ubiquitin domain at the c- related [Cystoisospora suis]|uniref:Ubiquitin domain at the c-related n=1 Tax=Cystoisospora suis TaxID=483139 RepID=A0A2C6L5G1_9APIC|nr:ubiquitin domain at the c- related [Cystoisospora suis]